MAQKRSLNLIAYPCSRLDRLDLGVGLAILALLGAILLTLLRGNHVGISVRRFLPQGLASSQTVIQIAFDEPLDPESVAGKLSLTPEAAGALSVVGNQLEWRPNSPLQQGKSTRCAWRRACAPEADGCCYSRTSGNSACARRKSSSWRRSISPSRTCS